MEKPLKISYIEPVGESGGMYHYNIGLVNNIIDENVKILLYSTVKNRKNYQKDIIIYNCFKNVWNKKSKFLKGTLFLVILLGSVIHSRIKQSKIIHLHLFKIDLIDLLTLAVAKMIGLKIIATVHDIIPFKGNNKEKVERIYLKNLDSIIVHNQYSKKVLLTKTSNKSIHVVPHGNYIPFIKNANQDSSKTYKFLPEDFNILFFGLIKDSKGLDVLLSAIRYVIDDKPKVKLHVYGKIWKSNINKYSKIISDLGLQNNVETRFKYIEDKDLPYLFKNTNLVVLPYKSIFQSGVLLFSMSYKKVTLVSDLPPFLEIIDDGINGFVFKKNDSKDLADKLLLIINKKDELVCIGNNAYQTILEEYDWGDIGKMTLKVYKGLINVNI